MKLKTLLLATACVISFANVTSAQNMAPESSVADKTVAGNTDVDGVSGGKVTDARVAAESFIQHINFARVTLALNSPAEAKDHLAKAKELIAALKENQGSAMTHVGSGHLRYQNTVQHNYYYPIGNIDIEKVKTGPFWARNKGLAVTDAEIVYVDLDLRGEDAGKHLDDALAQIDQHHYDAAQTTLSALVDSVIKEESVVPVPLEKARDNLMLARDFVDNRDYKAARYALDHAKSALKAAQRDTRYAGRKTELADIGSQITTLQADINTDDPSMIERADAKISQWWHKLKD